jgi:hypothetical protein
MTEHDDRPQGPIDPHGPGGADAPPPPGGPQRTDTPQGPYGTPPGEHDDDLPDEADAVTDPATQAENAGTALDEPSVAPSSE